MRRAILAGAVALLLLGGISPAPGALAGSQRPEIWWLQNVRRERVDLGEPGVSIGDQFIWHDLLGETKALATKYPTGEMSTICTVVDARRFSGFPPMACEVVIHFIEQGVIVSENCCWSVRGLKGEPTPFKVILPITGGARMLEKGRGGKLVFDWFADERARIHIKLAP